MVLVAETPRPTVAELLEMPVTMEPEVHDLQGAPHRHGHGEPLQRQLILSGFT
jgi:hypothetical protein